VGGFLDLRNLTSIPDGFNPTVGSSLYLCNLTSIPDGFNPTVGSSLDLRNLTSIPDGFNPTVGSSLYLCNLTSIPDGFNPTVGSYLDLRNLTSIPDGFNPTVGGSLDLCNLTSIPDGFRESDYENKDTSSLFWKNEKYIKTDGIFAEVISRKKNVWRLKKIGDKTSFYCVSDGNGKYAHGDSIKKAKEDLIYKLSGEANKEAFINMPLDTVLPFSKCIELYRVMTGACAFGVRNFIESYNIEHRDYSIAEIIEKTKGQYGSERLVFNHA
jgi:hypothetical protein